MYSHIDNIVDAQIAVTFHMISPANVNKVIQEVKTKVSSLITEEIDKKTFWVLSSVMCL